MITLSYIKSSRPRVVSCHTPRLQLQQVGPVNSVGKVLFYSFTFLLAQLRHVSHVLKLVSRIPSHICHLT